ncbi:MAG TPA: ribonuclease H [Candidatus Paceibacterota bacterium]
MIQDSILIFTDGASKGNPGPGGWGVVIAFSLGLSAESLGEKVIELGGRQEHTTNNRMELTAAIKALEGIPDLLKSSKPQALSPKLRIYSDSTHLINGITKWVHGWKRNGWITSTKKEVENRDLWESLNGLVTGKHIEWKKVTGHADTPGNARADEIASAFGDGEKPKLYSGLRAQYPLDLSVIGAREGSTRRRGEAYSYVSRVDGVVQTHKTWKECEARVKGKKARYKKAMSHSEEKALIAEFSSR